MNADREIDVLARTVYGEARGESQQGRIAVAWVVINRANKGGWWGDDIIEVCLQPKQFSSWNDADPNRIAMMKADMEDPVYRACYQAALAAYTGTVPDPTRNATHFHAHRVTPTWSAGKLYISIGGHRFYSNID